MSLTITHTPADGTLLEGTSKGDGSIDAIRGAGIRGWKWFRSIGIWGISHSRDRAPDLYRINRTAEALRAAGFEVDVEVDAAPRPMEQAEADRADRMQDRADALSAKAERKAAESDAAEAASRQITDMIPMGQPILVDHYSAPRHRRALDRAHRHMERSWETHREAQQAADGAESAASHMARRENPRTILRRIERLEADRRRVQRDLDGHTRRHLNHDGTPLYVDETPPATGPRRVQLEVQAEHLDEQLRYWRECIERAKADGSYTEIDWKTVKPGDLIKCWRGWERVARVNRTTVTIDTAPGWHNKVKMTDVTGYKPAEAVAGETAGQ